ncbi:MAG: MinD/ParA family protein [Lachnospiraceae bacterium]
MDQAEQLRNIVKLQNQRTTGNARVITVTSGKGGVGKSNVSVNLAVQLQKIGKKVIIFDADFGLANVEVMIGAIPKYNLSDLIYNGKNIQEIITDGPEGMGFISGGSGIVGLSNLTRDQIAFFIHNLSYLDNIADVILIDTGAGIADSVLEFALASPEIILVTTPEPSSLTDSYSLLKALHRNPNFNQQETVIKVLSNKVNSVEDGNLVYEKLVSVVTKFLNGKIDYLGMIPMDPFIDKAIRQQKPVSLCYPNAKSSKAFKTIADSLASDKHAQIQMKKGITQLFSNFLNKRN